MDEQYNLEWAKSLASGVWSPPYDQLRNAPYFRAPLYSYFLAGLFRLFGPNALIARIVQIILGSVSCALAYGVGTKCFGRRVGVVTGGLCSFYWVLAYFDSQLLQPVLLIVLLLAGLLAALVAAERRDARLAGLAGLGFGLYAITRPEILIFFPLVIWWAMKVGRGTATRMARWFVVLLALGFLLPPALATVRNRAVSGDWVVVASQGGVNFYIGNNPQSNGMQAVVPGTHESWWGGFEDTKAIAEKAAGHSLKASEISAYWFRRGFTFMRQGPARWLRLTLRKAALSVGNVEIPNNEPYEAHRGNYLSLKSIPLGFGLLLGLFVVSLPQMLGLRRRDHLGTPSGADPADSCLERAEALRHSFVSLVLQLMLVYALTTIAFFVTGRYRVPLVPLIAMGAAVTIVRLWDAVRARHLASVLGMVLVAGVLTGLLSVDYFGVRKATGGFTEYTDALDMLDTGNLDGAIASLEAIRKQQTVRAPEVYLSLARAYITRNRPEDGDAILRVAEDGLLYYPNEPELLWYAALGHVVSREWDPARDRIERLLAQEPQDMRALHLGFTIAMAQGRTEDARVFLKRAQAIDSANPLVQDMQSRLAPSGP
jgi:4-amino-4-deoxy-L-arabinose transferase-like glycosyltransferase